MANFVPNEDKKISPRNPPWFGNEIKRNFRKQNDLYRKFNINGFKPKYKVAIK